MRWVRVERESVSFLFLFVFFPLSRLRDDRITRSQRGYKTIHQNGSVKGWTALSRYRIAFDTTNINSPSPHIIQGHTVPLSRSSSFRVAPRPRSLISSNSSRITIGSLRGPCAVTTMHKGAVRLPGELVMMLPHALSHAHQALLISPRTRTHPTVPVVEKRPKTAISH